MTVQKKFDVAPPEGDRHTNGGMRHGHSWMMVACCIPMLVIAIVLVATGIAGVGFIFIAVICTVMMAMMMGAMDHGGDKT
jgi:cytosine/uracil/thiamine/allantoin permease